MLVCLQGGSEHIRILGGIFFRHQGDSALQHSKTNNIKVSEEVIPSIFSLSLSLSLCLSVYVCVSQCTALSSLLHTRYVLLTHDTTRRWNLTVWSKTRPGPDKAAPIRLKCGPAWLRRHQPGRPHFRLCPPVCNWRDGTDDKVA